MKWDNYRITSIGNMRTDLPIGKDNLLKLHNRFIDIIEALDYNPHEVYAALNMLIQMIGQDYGFKGKTEYHLC